MDQNVCRALGDLNPEERKASADELQKKIRPRGALGRAAR